MAKRDGKQPGRRLRKARVRTHLLRQSQLAFEPLEVRQLLALTPTAVSLVSSSQSVVYSTPITLTANVETVPAGAPVSGGTVTFLDGTSTLGTVAVNAGTASLSSVVLPAGGVNPLTASYSGSAANNIGASASSVSPGSIITTVAGYGFEGNGGNGGPATAATLDYPDGVAVDSAGDIFIADTGNNVVREVNHATGVITTVAGNGSIGFSGDDGPATAAELSHPTAVAVDSAGDVFIADSQNDRIREINHTTGTISTVAGDGNYGYNGDGIPATLAYLADPMGLAVDTAGDLFVADSGTDRIREVNAATGIITTIAGIGAPTYNGDNIQGTAAGLNNPTSVAVDSYGDLFIADANNFRVRELNLTTGMITTFAGNGTRGESGDGGLATAAELNYPQGVAVDSTGDVFIADTSGDRIREVNHVTGLITTVAGGGSTIGDGGPASAALLGLPPGLAVDARGDLFIADAYNQRVREISAATQVTITQSPVTVTVSDSGGTFNSLTFAATASVNGQPALEGISPTLTYYGGSSPSSFAPVSPGMYQVVASFAGSADFLAAQSSPVTFSITPASSISLISSSQNIAYATPLTLTAFVFAVPSGEVPAGGTVEFFDAATLLGTATLGSNGMASLNDVLLTSQGVNTLSATYLGSPAPNAVAPSTTQITSSSIINTIAGVGFSGNGDNGEPATAASLSYPEGVVVDSAGDVFIAATYNNAVYEVNHLTGLLTTAAGGGAVPAFGGDGGPATAASLNSPSRVAVDSAGDLFIVDAGNDRIREVNHLTGIITTVAGSALTSYAGDGGPATAAGLKGPDAVSVDTAGDLFIADAGDQRVREVNAATGIITTIAGNGIQGYNGDSIPGSAAELNYPTGIALSPSGVLYIADSQNNRVRALNLATGIITTVAGNGTQGYNGDSIEGTAAELASPGSVAVDSSGDLLIADELNNRIREVNASNGIITTVAGNGNNGYSGDGFAATSAELDLPAGVAFDAAGNLYIADSGNNRVREIAAGVHVTVGAPGAIPIVQVSDAGGTYDGLPFPATPLVDGQASLGGVTPTVSYYSGTAASGSALPSAPSLAGTYTVVASYAGNTNYNSGQSAPATFFIATPTTISLTASASIVPYNTPITLTAVVQSVPATAVTAGAVTFLDGNTTLGTATVSNGLATLSNVVLPSSGVNYLSASYSGSSALNLGASTTVVSPSSVITTVAGNGNTQYSGNNGPATAASLYEPADIAFDSVGDLFIADTMNNVIREVNHTTGVITTVAGTGGFGFSGNGGPATAALLARPTAIALDSAGDIFFIDSLNYRVREINHATGIITTVAGTGNDGYNGDGKPATLAYLQRPLGLAVDTAGDLFIADTGNARIREVNAATGIITTIAGGGSDAYSENGIPGTLAALNWPAGIALDSAGDLFIADSDNFLVRELNLSTDIITTVAGDGSSGFTGDGGPATAAELDLPTAVAVDSAGDLFVAGPSSVREVTAATGNITTVAGDSYSGFGGDNGPASAAEFDGPQGMAIDSAGDLFIADTYNQRIREVLAGAQVNMGPGAVTVSVSDAGGPYNASAYPATVTVAGLTSLEGVTPTLSYYSGTAASGTPSTVAPSLAGTYTAVGSFAGSPDYPAGQSAPLTFVISPALVTLTLSPPVLAINYGQPVTLTATVSGSTTPNDGTVTFTAGGTELGTVSVIAGSAQLTTSSLASSTSVVAATYNDPGGNYASASTVLSGSSAIITAAGINDYGNGGAATTAILDAPDNVAVDSAGDIFIADSANNVVREVNHVTGVISIVAGTGATAYNGDNIAATAANLNDPLGIVLDSAGDLFISDYGNNRIREVNHATGLITTIAGNNSREFSGDGGPATAAALSGPNGLALDSAGDLFVVDSGNERIREINAVSQVITTFAGNGSSTYAGDGGLATAASLALPTDVATDSAGDVFIASIGDSRIREVNYSSGVINTVAGNGNNGSIGNGPATAASLSRPLGLALDSAGDLFFANANTNVICEVNAATGLISVVAGNGSAGSAGDGGPATAAALNDPTGVAFDSDGDLFIADDANNRVREVNQLSQMITTVAGSGYSTYSGNGGPATAAALNAPKAVAVDSVGDVFIADTADNIIREVNHFTGIMTTVAGNGTAGYAGDNGPATAAELNAPAGIAVDSAGDLFISDTENNRIREVNHSTGLITTVAGTGAAGYNGNNVAATAAQVADPQGMALDSVGDLFVATSTNRIEELNAATQLMTTVAGTGVAGFAGDGSPATAAELFNPTDVAVDSAGNLYIADTFNNRIREVNASTGLISTVVGNGVGGSYNVSGPATAAALGGPQGILVDSAGNLWIADTYGSLVQEVNAATDLIATIAGYTSVPVNGSSLGDGGPATTAALYQPVGLAFDLSGDLLIADSLDDRIREVVNGAIVQVEDAPPFILVADAGGTYNGSPYSATVSANGSASVEGVTPTVSYYSGTSASGPALSGAPSAAGTYVAVGSFAGSTDFSAGQSAPITFVISPAATTLSLAASASQVSYGQTVTLTATIAASPAPSEGTVTFTSNGSTLGAVPVSAGTARLVISNLPTGTNKIIAAFSDAGGNYATASLSGVSPSSPVITAAGANYGGNGGPATTALLNNPSAVAVDLAGDLFIVDSSNNVVREVNHATGVISVVAGTGIAGYNGDNIPATAAELSRPDGIVLDSVGDLFISEWGNDRVREVNHATGMITTVAGTGVSGYGGDGGPATAALLNQPSGLAFDSVGNLYIADESNNRVREVNLATGVITTMAGNGSSGFSGDGGQPTAASFDSPSGLAFDSAGDLFIADAGNERIREVNRVSGLITTVAGNGTSGASGSGAAATAAELDDPVSIAVDSAGDLFIADAFNSEVRKVNAGSGVITVVAGTGNFAYSGDGGPASIAALDDPRFITLDSAGDLLIADSGNNRIREVNHTTQVITTMVGSGYLQFSGNGGPATAASLSSPKGVATNSAGDIFIADTTDNVIREINHATGIITTVAGNGIAGYLGDGVAATATELNAPAGIAVDLAGDLFIADTGNNRIREVNHVTGLITTVAGSGSWGYNGDNIAATAAALGSPAGIAVDSAGDLFIADAGNARIREVSAATQLITTIAGDGVPGFAGDGSAAVAAELFAPYGVAVDSVGDVFIADTANGRIREVNHVTGIVTTVAGTNVGFGGDGGPATAATLADPYGIAVDSAGDLFIADTGDSRVREVNATTGVITTVAGNSNLSGFGVDGYGDDGPGSAAGLSFPASVALDASGDLLIADWGQDRVRELVNGVVVAVSQQTPVVAVADGGGTYTGSPYPATATVNGSASLEGLAPTVSYYPGTIVNGAPLSGAPSTAGTYTVLASFAGSTDYSSTVASTTFSITPAAPTLVVSDAGGTYTGSAFPATATVNGSASLEGATPTLSYYPGTTATGTALSGAPSSAGTYTALASFAGSTDYSSATASTTFTITQAAPSLNVSDNSGVFTGTPFSASDSITGIGSQSTAAASLESVSPTLAYYTGTAASGSALAGAPSSAGAYTVLASFAGSTDYTSASASTTFTINQAAPTVSVSDNSGLFTGAPFTAATATIEGITPALLYYSGTAVTGTTLSGAPSSAGTYTVVASFAGSADYTSGAASTTFTIDQSNPTILVVDNDGTYTSLAYQAGANSIEGVSPALFYYSGTAASGTALSGAPSTVGTYSVLASFAGSTDYTSGTASTTFTIGKAAPSFYPTIFTDGVLMAGVGSQSTPSISLEGVTPTLAYYSGTSATGSPLAGRPSTAGTYTALASFAGSSDYTPIAASQAFTISAGTPTVSVLDPSGPYDDAQFIAAATVNGVSSLEGVTPTLSYYSGTAAMGTALVSAPSTAGTYTVLASFAGSTDYNGGSASATFTITRAAPTVHVSASSGTYRASAFNANPTVAGVGNQSAAAASLEGITPALTYYSGSTATGSPLGSPPSHAGTYTVVASFAGSTDYAAAQSNSATFVIQPAPLTITANDQMVAYGDPLPTLTASYSGFLGNDSPASLTVHPTLSTTATSTSPITGNPYPIYISGAIDPDYTISYVAGQLTITSAVPPSSSVNALDYRTSNSSISVSWSGTPGSGGPIGSYNVYVSTNNGPFTTWQTNTASTSAIFAATVGNTYGFSSQATDAAGETEAMHSTADTTVAVMAMPWQNPGNPLDVLGTGGAIVPADVLAIIDYLNLHPGVSSLPATAPGNADYYDVLGENSVVPADALAVIDYLNLHPASQVVAPAVAPPAAVPTADGANETVAGVVSQLAPSPAALAIDLGPTSAAENGALAVAPAVMAVASLSANGTGAASSAASIAPTTDASAGPNPLAKLAPTQPEPVAADALFSDAADQWWGEP